MRHYSAACAAQDSMEDQPLPRGYSLARRTAGRASLELERESLP